MIDLVGSLTAGPPLRAQTAVLHASQAPSRPWLDLAYQLDGIAVAVVPVLLAVYLLGQRPTTDGRAGWVVGARRIGLDTRRPLPDLGLGAVLAAVIGIPGLALYLGAYAAGLSVTVNPANLPQIWWAPVVYVLSAVQNALLEETVVVGFTLSRLRRAGVGVPVAVACSAVLRGSYHLYQGFGAFVGNAVMGVVFALVYRRTGRVLPLVIAHSLIDVVAFVGYAALGGHVSWLPG